MLLAFLADLHLPYRTDTVPYDVLRWALAESASADLLVVAGDFTAAGDREAIDAFASILAASPVPTVVLCGNAEYRSTPENAAAARALESPVLSRVGDWTVLSLRDGGGTIPDEVFDALTRADRRTLVVGHHSLRSLPEPHRSRMTAWRQAHPDTMLFTAHHHRFLRPDPHTVELPAADPDKAIGEEPSILFYNTDSGEVRQSLWHSALPADFADHIGISCRAPAMDIPYAAAHGIRMIELRPDAVQADRPALLSLLARWRACGGTTLSLHAPDVHDDPAKNGAWAAFAAFAAEVGADRITLHVPRVSVAQVRADGALLSRMAGYVGDALSALPPSLVIGVENMHMTAKDTPDDRRRFGYLPDECRAWRDALAAVAGKVCGLHLDVGHARNNKPYSEKYTLSAWYADIGREITGYHLHQISRDGGVWENHTPIDSWYGPLISYVSFFDAWNRGQLAKAPLILEIRTPRGYEKTVEMLGL